MQTFQILTKSFQDKQYPALCNLLSKEQTIIASIDNNQKGHCPTYQKNESSNNFVRVTGRIFKKYTDIPTVVKSLPI